MKFDDFVARFVAAHQFDTTTRTIEPTGQQMNQRFVGRGIHRRRGDPDSQFVTVSVMRHNFIRRRARLKFHRQQSAVRLRAQESGNRCACHL